MDDVKKADRLLMNKPLMEHDVLEKLRAEKRKQRMHTHVVSLKRVDALSDYIRDHEETAGYVTCFKVGKLIVVGTSHGYVFIFNHFEKMLGYLYTKESM